MEITPREKGRRGGVLFFCLPSASRLYIAWGDFYARSRFARSAIPEEKRELLVV